ncbi:bacteriocin [Enterococcus faecalis]|uniref:bacteriocin n=1 Tax=Enterococcus faecalis TaxID=1351 RepID=UPI002FBDA256
MKKTISGKELKKIKGGFGPAAFLIPIGGYLAKQAFEHTDQIAKGFKKGWNGK